jgi:hypothetical protein
MVLVHSRFSNFILFAAYQTASRLSAGLGGALRRSERRWLTSTIDLRDSKHRPSWSCQNTSQRLPASVFDARYRGLTGHAACLDAGISRRERLRLELGVSHCEGARRFYD